MEGYLEGLVALLILFAVFFSLLRYVGLYKTREAAQLAGGTLIALVLGLALSGCTITQTVGAPTPVPSPSPTPSPSASPAPTGAVRPWEVKVVFVNEEVCPPGTSPNTADRTFRVGCDQMFTCTPKIRLADGSTRDATPAEVGHAPGSFGPEFTPTASFAPPGYLRVDGGNAYNIHARASSPGRLDLKCVVQGVEGRNTYAVTS